MKQERKQAILNFLKDGPKTTKQIAAHLGVSQSYTRKLIAELREEGFIESVYAGGIKQHALTKKGTLTVKAQNTDNILKARVHNIRVSCYVLDADWLRISQVGKEVKMNNWVSYFVNLGDLVDLSKFKDVPNIKIRFNIAKANTATLFLPSFYARDKWDAARQIHNTFQKIGRVLDYGGIILDRDWIKMKCVYGEYAFEIDQPLDPGHEIRLGRKAKDPMDNELETEARVWVDESEGREVETNDADYTHKYLMMPEYIAEMRENMNHGIKAFADFLTKFERVLEKQNETIEKQNENLTKSTELQLAFAQNLASHVPYVQNASAALIETKNVLTETTKMVQLMQKHQRTFFMGIMAVIAVLVIALIAGVHL